jgi:hypothetical protein
MADKQSSWFRLVVTAGATLDRPGIYEWRIEGVGSYIGKFTKKGRPLNDYQRNVARLIDRKPYRPKRPEAFRHIHRVLATAVSSGTPVTLIIVENPPLPDINRRERELIRLRGVLNRL